MPLFRVTGPVTSATSACRGDATSRAPYRSASRTRLKGVAISISQRVSGPRITQRTCTRGTQLPSGRRHFPQNAPPKSRR